MSVSLQLSSSTKVNPVLLNNHLLVLMNLVENRLVEKVENVETVGEREGGRNWESTDTYTVSYVK